MAIHHSKDFRAEKSIWYFDHIFNSESFPSETRHSRVNREWYDTAFSSWKKKKKIKSFWRGKGFWKRIDFYTMFVCSAVIFSSSVGRFKKWPHRLLRHAGGTGNIDYLFT